MQRCAWKKFLFFLNIICIMAAPVSSGAAMPAMQNPSIQPTGTAAPTDLSEGTAHAAQAFSNKNTLTLAKDHLESGRLDEAEKLYADLRKSASEVIRIEATFQLGMIRLLQGKYRQAASLFLEILNQHPGLARVRLELARAYFLDKNYGDATFQFELVKGSDLPPDVQANIDRFLDAIRRQKNWTIDFGLSPVTDSNINQASGGRQECINTIYGLLCRPLAQKASGYGLNANATVDYYWRFHRDWGLRATLGFYGTAYEEQDYNDYILAAALGPRYLWESGEASLQPTYRKRWIADEEYSNDQGLRLDLRQIFNRLILDVGAAYYYSEYDNAYVNSFLEGPSWNVRFQARYILTNQTFVQGGLAFMREETKARAYANDSLRYSLGAYHAFPYGFSLFVEGSLMQTDYKGMQWYVTRDNRIDETVRKDTTWQMAASLSSNIFERYNLTPVFQYSYTKRYSNIWTREYDRHRLNFLVNYRF